MAISRVWIDRVWIDRAAIAIGLVALVIGVLTPVVATTETGVHLGVEAERVVVTSVDPYSPAAQYGIEPGMVALEVNGRVLVRGPQYVYPPTNATPDPMTGEVPEKVPVVEPAVPTFANLTQEDLQAIADQPLTQLWAIRPTDLAAWTADEMPYAPSISDDGRNSLQESILSVIVGIAVLFSIAWWLTSGRAGSSLRDLGLPLAVATATPFLLRPLDYTWSPVAVAVLAAMVPMAMLPLAAALIARIEDPQDRGVAIAAVATCAIGAAIVGAARAVNTPDTIFSIATWVLTAGITAIPGLIAAGPAIPGALRAVAAPGGEATASGRLLQSTELAVVGFTPAAAMATTSVPYLFPFALWIGAIGLAGRFTVRPLARLASRAQLQRDLIVAATEAERARVAADIHDDALQELTLLVRRLDAAGDAEGADIARGVSDRLRAICGDLRLPILDDLGVGPALDWLVLRIERLAGGEVRLERSDGTRPPPDVELAFFRVAQEALSNAVKHGKPPILVRYRSGDGAASLSIDDAGSGITPDAGERAEREGHFGLLNMQQRAEGVGAILDVRRWPAGGTHVQLEWRAR
jgi:signal transduction histidine kinase